MLVFYVAHGIFRLPAISYDYTNFVATALPLKPRILPMRKRLSPRVIKALKPGRDGITRGDVVMDDHTKNLGIRVLGSPERPSYTFVYVGRFPGYSSSARVALAPFISDPTDEEVAADSLKRARAKAYAWGNAIAEGRDPRVEERRQREAVVRAQATTFGAVAEDFITQKLPFERRGADVERELRREFLPVLGKLPVTDVTDEHVIRIIRAKAKTAPTMARNLFTIINRLYTWARGQRVYGLKANPCSDIKIDTIVGRKIARDRLLNDDEVRAFWRAASRMAYPARDVYRMLISTGLRLAEVSDASWSEFHPTVVRALRQRGAGPIDWTKFDPQQLIWTVPADRMKGRPDSAMAHVVPLTLDMLRILEELPQFFGDGGYLFSRNGGRKPAVMSSDIKAALDKRMLRTLRAMARQRGDDPAAVQLEPWVQHDLRRVVRSGLSRLKVTEEIREAVLAHKRAGIKGVYDRHDYVDEKRDALQKWGALLRSIVEPAPAETNVVQLRG
jgi:integrase